MPHPQNAPDSNEQRIADLADVSGIGGVEGRAIFEVHLLRTLRFQPGQGLQRLGHRLCGRQGARLERHHHRIHLDIQRAVGHTDGLHHPHVRAHQVVGQISGAGEVIGYAA